MEREFEMTPDDLSLYAKNCGNLYPVMCGMAKTNAPQRSWETFVKLTIIPQYKRECHEPFEGMSLDEISETATDLKDHYAEHVKELEPSSPEPTKPTIMPRRPFDDDKPDGYQESDRDYVVNNIDACVAYLDRKTKGKT
jgi:hypothetical protein